MPRVDFCSRWDNPHVLNYNRYYLHGLHDAATLTSSTRPWYVAPFGEPAAGARVSLFLMSRIFPRLGRRYPNEMQYFVGQYVLRDGSDTIRFAIDPHDNRKIASKPILDWADVYFKSNKWRSERYPSKVLPIVNGNGIHDRQSLAFLRSLRDAPKEWDFTFVSRLATGVEHNLRIFEALSRVKGRKRLIAVLYEELGQGEYVRTLEGFGVTCVGRTLPARELWTLLGRSRVNFIRLGMKYCVPWRMIDFLCMGSCLVLDRRPLSDWPAPLDEGRHFVSCFGDRDVDAAPLDYRAVTETVERVAASPDLVEAIARANADYYDRHAAPERVADYMLRALAARDAIDPCDTAYGEDVAPWPADTVWMNNV